ALESDRGDVMLAAAVRTAADLDARAVGCRSEIGPRAQVILEQPSQTARLRDRQPARLRAGAARDVGDRFGAAQSETGGRQPAIQGTEVGRRDPPEHET